jgi:hypothetical protein
MNLNQNKAFIFAIFIICLACLQPAQGQQKDKKLSEIRAVFIEVDESLEKFKDFGDYLKPALNRIGFSVVEEREKSEAILKFKNWTAQIFIHGTQYDIDKLFYEFDLSLTSGKIIWKKTAKFISNENWEARNKIAAQKIAELLYYDRQKAEKKDKTTKEK